MIIYRDQLKNCKKQKNIFLQIQLRHKLPKVYNTEDSQVGTHQSNNPAQHYFSDQMRTGAFSVVWLYRYQIDLIHNDV